MMTWVQQISAVWAIVLLIGYLFGVTFGVVGGAVFGLVRENHRMSLLEQAPDSISAGARRLLGLHTLDDGYLRSLPPTGRKVAEESREDDFSGEHGQGVEQ